MIFHNTELRRREGREGQLLTYTTLDLSRNPLKTSSNRDSSRPKREDTSLIDISLLWYDCYRVIFCSIELVEYIFLDSNNFYGLLTIYSVDCFNLDEPANRRIPTINSFLGFHDVFMMFFCDITLLFSVIISWNQDSNDAFEWFLSYFCGYVRLFSSKGRAFTFRLQNKQCHWDVLPWQCLLALKKQMILHY